MNWFRADENEKFLCRGLNMSRDGFYLLKLPERDHRRQRFVWLQFWLPNSDELIHVLGEIVREEAEYDFSAVGVRFRYVAPHYQKLIDDYLANSKAEDMAQA